MHLWSLGTKLCLTAVECVLLLLLSLTPSPSVVSVSAACPWVFHAPVSSFGVSRGSVAAVCFDLKITAFLCGVWWRWWVDRCQIDNWTHSKHISPERLRSQRDFVNRSCCSTNANKHLSFRAAGDTGAGGSLLPRVFRDCFCVTTLNLTRVFVVVVLLCHSTRTLPKC